MKTALKHVASPPYIPASNNGGQRDGERQKKEVGMLEAILIILVVLWALGLFAFHAGGLIHVLIVIALVVLILRLLKGRKIF